MRVIFLMAVLTLVCGCGQPANPTTPPVDKDKTDIHIHTPKANVDIQGKSSGGTDINVQRTNR